MQDTSPRMVQAINEAARLAVPAIPQVGPDLAEPRPGLGTASWGECQSPPRGNTGDKLTSDSGGCIPGVKVDWINCTFPARNREFVQEGISALLGEAELRSYGANTYERMCTWESGARLCWNEDRPREECWLSLNGDSVDRACKDGLLRFMEGLAKMGARGTRLDLAADFPRDVLSVDQVHAAAAAGHVCGFRAYEAHRPMRNLFTGELRGNSAQFGRRGKEGSGRFVRVYDKFLESGGKIDATRIELELSAGHAEATWQLLLGEDSDEGVTRLIGKLVAGSIDFADRSKAHGHRDRFVRLPWWSSVVQMLGHVELVVPRRDVPLQESLEYFKLSWACNLAKLHAIVEDQGMDGDLYLAAFMSMVVQHGRRRQSAYRLRVACQAGLDLEGLLRPPGDRSRIACVVET